VQRSAFALKIGGQHGVVGSAAQCHRASFTVDDKIRIDAAKVDQFARRIGDAVEGVAGADRANPRRPSDDVAQLGHRGRAMDAGGRESMIVGPVVLAR